VTGFTIQFFDHLVMTNFFGPPCIVTTTPKQ